MDFDDRIDNALRAIARAGVSRDLARHVRARIEAGDEVRAAWWPRVATACGAVLVGGAALLWMRQAPPPRVTQVAPATVASTATASVASAPTREPLAGPPDVARRTAVSAVTASATPRKAATTASDHERALSPLASIDAIRLPSIAPDAMVVAEHVIAPLAPIAPLPAVHEWVADAERGEL